jgi:hypothetical protein
LHVEHLSKWCPQVLPYLALPPRLANPSGTRARGRLARSFSPSSEPLPKVEKMAGFDLATFGPFGISLSCPLVVSGFTGHMR